ncbi:MAG: lipase family protein [Gemmataceae bacterium]
MPPEPRPLPAETIDGLRPPLEGFPYFAHADRFPLESHASGHSAINAWWLADASFLVYGGGEFIEGALAGSPLPGQGFRVDWLGTREDNRGIVLANDSALVVVFRGTRLQVHTLLDSAAVVLLNQDDLWTDSQFIPAAGPSGWRAHSGFLKAFAEVSSRLDEVVAARRPGQKLWLAGHSLGGALATLAAAHVGASAVQGLYTYGSPRVGDEAFTALLPPSVCRFVHRDDWVATVPPALLGYAHAGDAVPVPGSPPRNFWNDLASGAGEFGSALREVARSLRLNTGDFPLKVAGLADHAPVYYATLLWNALLAAEG